MFVLTLDPDQVFRVSKEAIAKRLEDEVVIVEMKTGQIYTLNDTGARVWDLLCAGHNRKEIFRIMSQEYEVNEEDLDNEIRTVLIELQNKSIITADDSKAKL